MIERRKHSRVNIHCRVFFEAGDMHDPEAAQDIGIALDISEKGMLLESGTPIHAPTIKVVVPLREKRAVEFMGNVIYSIPMPDERYHTGIVFHGAGDDIAELVELLRRQS